MDSKAKKSEAADSVPIPESFQKEVKTLLKGANKQQLSFVRDCCCQCESDNAELKEAEFSDKDMPS